LTVPSTIGTTTAAVAEVKVRNAAAVIGVVLVVLEVGTAVVINVATGGAAPWWVWIALGGLVLATCALVWWRERRLGSGSSTDVRVRARRKAVIERTPVKISSPGQQTSVSIEADKGRITNSGVTITGSQTDQPDRGPGGT
jgi:hypothetical protein